MTGKSAASMEVMDLAYAAGWTDGLPIIPPERDLVNQYIEILGRPADELIGMIPPLLGPATVEIVVANAIMAGCRPEYLPVVFCALEALLDDKLNIGGMQCSTHLSTPLLIINGPVRQELDINCGPNVFGQGWRANATIGRAVKLVLTNVGGARPGETDKATLGQPGKYTFCIGENEEQSPWEPLHVERGFSPTDSTVMVYGSEGPHNINNQMVDNPHDLLDTIASMMANLGSNHPFLMGESLVVLCPEHAAVCADAGWNKRDVKQYLWETARVQLARLRKGGIYGADVDKYNTWSHWIDRTRDDLMVPVCRRAEDITVVVAGGPGRHSAYLPGWSSRSAIRPLNEQSSPSTAKTGAQ